MEFTEKKCYFKNNKTTMTHWLHDLIIAREDFSWDSNEWCRKLPLGWVIACLHDVWGKSCCLVSTLSTQKELWVQQKKIHHQSNRTTPPQHTKFTVTSSSNCYNDRHSNERHIYHWISKSFCGFRMLISSVWHGFKD